MRQKIIGFHTDEENHWVADLECGHRQHVRHDPPWMERTWVITPEGRRSRLGVELDCVRCDEAGRLVATAVRDELLKTLREAHESAGISGLCAEGRWDVALDALRAADLAPVIEAALKPASRRSET